jgi:hypothetical protein
MGAIHGAAFHPSILRFNSLGTIQTATLRLATRLYGAIQTSVIRYCDHLEEWFQFLHGAIQTIILVRVSCAAAVFQFFYGAIQISQKDLYYLNDLGFNSYMVRFKL